MGTPIFFCPNLGSCFGEAFRGCLALFIELTFGALVLDVVDAGRGPEGLRLRAPVLAAEDAPLLLGGVLCGPAVEVLLEEAEARAVGPRLGAGDGLVVVAVEAAVEDPLEGPAALRVAQPVELALAHCKRRCELNENAFRMAFIFSCKYEQNRVKM